MASARRSVAAAWRALPPQQQSARGHCKLLCDVRLLVEQPELLLHLGQVRGSRARCADNCRSLRCLSGGDARWEAVLWRPAGSVHAHVRVQTAHLAQPRTSDSWKSSTPSSLSLRTESAASARRVKRASHEELGQHGRLAERRRQREQLLVRRRRGLQRALASQHRGPNNAAHHRCGVSAPVEANGHLGTWSNEARRSNAQPPLLT